MPYPSFITIKKSLSLIFFTKQLNPDQNKVSAKQKNKNCSNFILPVKYKKTGITFARTEKQMFTNKGSIIPLTYLFVTKKNKTATTDNKKKYIPILSKNKAKKEAESITIVY